MSNEPTAIANIVDIELALEDIKQNMDSMFLIINGIIVTCEYPIYIIYITCAPTYLV